MTETCIDERSTQTETKRQFSLRQLFLAMTGICCLVCFCTSYLDFLVLVLVCYLVLGIVILALTILVVAAQVTVAMDSDARKLRLKFGGRTILTLLISLVVAYIALFVVMLAGGIG